MNKIYDMKFVTQDSVDDLKDLRDQYLNSLTEPQEMFLELQIRDSNVILIKIDNRDIGYFSYNNDKTLLEFFIVDEFFSENENIFNSILNTYSLNCALCKSFDQNLLSIAINRSVDVQVVGINFRKLIPLKNTKSGLELSVISAIDSDFSIIKSINEEVFEEDDEIVDYLMKNQILMFKDSDAIVGFGIFAPVISNRNAYDIGMCVSSEYRGKGIGNYIINYLIDYCQRNGWRPIAGCEINNQASRKCLEGAGFYADNRLLLFKF